MAGLIVAGIVIFMGVCYVFEGARASETAAERDARLLTPAMGIMGGLAIGLRSFLPGITLGRGFCAWVSGAGLAIFLFMLVFHGVGRPGAMVGMLVLPTLGAIFGFRIGETRSERRRHQRQLESERAVRDAQAVGRAANVCAVCGGTGRCGRTLEWRCRTCRGAGYVVSAIENPAGK